MADLVQSFNSLPRPKTTASGLLNHWFFAVRHVPFNPPGDLVQIIHLESQFQHCEGPRQILSLTTPAAQSDVIVPLLLQSFITGISRGPNGEPLADMPSFAPWSWGTN